MIDRQHPKETIIFEIAHLQLQTAFFVIRVHLVHQAVQRVEMAAQIRTAHDVTNVVRRHRDRRGRIVTEPDRVVGTVGDRLVSDALQSLDVMMIQHTYEIVWPLWRRTRAGINGNERVSFVAVLDTVMVVPFRVLAVVRIDAIVVVWRIPRVDVEVVVVTADVQPDGLLGHIGRVEYLVIPDPFLFVLAAAQRIFAATVGQIAGCDDHLRSDDVDDFGTKRPQIFFSREIEMQTNVNVGDLRRERENRWN